VVNHKSVSELLYRLKREQPFKEFDIVTTEGKSVHVWNRFRFTYDDRQVLVGDERDRLLKLPFESIATIQERGATH
jgi:hypothetical protein